MPRKPRPYLAGMPCHVIQRGNNRQACFFDVPDYQAYLVFLQDATHRYRVAVHAYVLMTNHVHLLLTPENADGISRVMQSLGRRYVQNFNHRNRRTGTLWEGRHCATLIADDSYLLSCYRYIELNPVRAAMVGRPEDYRWSSFHHNALAISDPLISEHPLYDSLGVDPARRRSKYRALFEGAVPEHHLMKIRSSISCCAMLGSAAFETQAEMFLGVSSVRKRSGRV